MWMVVFVNCGWLLVSLQMLSVQMSLLLLLSLIAFMFPFDRKSSKPPSAILEDDLSDSVPAQNPMDHPTYKVRYLGEVFVGNTGGVDKIEEGVRWSSWGWG